MTERCDSELSFYYYYFIRVACQNVYEVCVTYDFVTARAGAEAWWNRDVPHGHAKISTLRDGALQLTAEHAGKRVL